MWSLRAVLFVWCYFAIVWFVAVIVCVGGMGCVVLSVYIYSTVSLFVCIVVGVVV